MTVCAVKGCHNKSEKHKKESKITFHVFPSDPDIAARWTEQIRLNRNKETWTPTKHTKICSVHFDSSEKYITKLGFCKLLLGAIPTKGLHIHCSDESHNGTDGCNKGVQHHEFSQSQLGSQAASSGDNQGQKKVAEVLDGKVLIFRVYSYLRHEYEELKAYTGNSCDLSPLANILKRTSGATGVSEHVIARILDEKRRSGQFQDEVPEKRAKLSHEAENSSISPTEETSSSVTTDNVQQTDNGGQQEQDAYEIKTLKVEVDEEAVQYNRSARCDTEEKTPLANPPQASSSKHNQRERCDTKKEKTWVSPQQSSREPSSADPQVTYTVMHAEVKIEPPDDDYQPSSSAVHHATATETHTRVKTESVDEIKDNPYMNASDSANNNATRATIKSEPMIHRHTEFVFKYT